MSDKINIRKLEADLWESADLLRAGSKLTSSQYCMPVLALLFLRYAYSRFKLVEGKLLANRPSRGGRVMPLEPSDFAAKSALFLPREAQFDYLVNLPDNVASAGLKNQQGEDINFQQQDLFIEYKEPDGNVYIYQIDRNIALTGFGGD